MNKTFKKIAASVMAITTLAGSVICFNTSAAETRTGGSLTFNIGGASATASIDKSTTFGWASTKCSNVQINNFYRRITSYEWFFIIIGAVLP